VAGGLNVGDAPERLIERLERGEADLAVGMMDIREKAVDRVRLGALARVEVDRQRRELAAVEGLPRRDRRPPRIERLLLTLRQDIRLLFARDPQPVRVRLELGRGKELVGNGVVEVEPLEVDEEKEAFE